MKKITILIALAFLGLMPLSAQWVTVGNARFSDNTTNYQDLAVDNLGVPYVAYQNLNDSGKVSVMKYYNGIWSYVGLDFPNGVVDTILPILGHYSSTYYNSPRIAFDNLNNPYVGYININLPPIDSLSISSHPYSAGYRLNVVKFNGVTWVPVGTLSDTLEYNLGSGLDFDLAIDPSGNPYVVYGKWLQAQSVSLITIMKYTAPNWSVVGSAGFDTSQSGFSLALDTAGIPYVFYSAPIGQKIQKYTGLGLTGWQALPLSHPNTVFGTTTGRGTLAIGKNNTLYQEFIDSVNETDVAKYNGTNWIVDIISQSPTTSQPLIVDKLNNLFVDHNNTGGVYTLTRCDTAFNNWNEGFPLNGGGTNNYLSIDNSAAFPIPYIAYLDGSKLTVQKHLCQAPSLPHFSTPSINICTGDTLTTNEVTPSDTVLNDAEYWQWYSGSCGGTPIGRGLHITLAPITSTYYVRGEGYCVVPDSCSKITVNVHAPVPGYNITSSGPTTFCSAAADTLNAGRGYTSYDWSTGSNMQTIYPHVSNVYGVTVTDSNGCVYHDTVSVNVLNTIPQSICIVSVDSASGYNNIVWDQTPGVDSFKVYAQTSVAGVYQLIGEQSSSLFSTLLDSTSNPAQQSSTYVMTAVNQCGESGYSAEHQTIHLSSNLGVGGSVNLIWNAYTGFSYPSFYIYRGSSATNMQQIATIPSTNLSYTDLTPPAPPVFYQVSVTNPNGCSPSRSASYNSSFSNVINVNTSGINSINYGELHIYCKENGYNTIVNFSVIINIPTLLKLYDLTGRMVFEQANFTGSSFMLPSNLSKGIYLLNVQNDNLSVTKKLIIGN